MKEVNRGIRSRQWTVLLGWLCAQSVFAAGVSEEDLQFFEARIRPILIEHCYECHSERAEPIQGGLRLDSAAALRQGGDSGPLLDLQAPRSSLLIQALRYEAVQMPPAGQLPDQVIEDFVSWIARGAADPRAGDAGVPRKTPRDMADRRELWSFQPIQRVPVPQPSLPGWAYTDIDHFLAARWQVVGLSPAPDADRATRLTRLHFDLTGLPPTHEQIAAFEADRAADAWARQVDRLLASPEFGQRWGQHWLDVARFAESSGGGRSLMLPEAWRYRDYVIETFNADRPWATFIREQLAGDLLPYVSDQQHDRQRIATGFLVLGPTNYETQDKELLEMDVIDEQIDTIGRAFMGMTLGCARCHDHKFDPVPMTDYYGLAGIFTSTQTLTPGNVSGYVKVELKQPDRWRSGDQPHGAVAMSVRDRPEPQDTHLLIRGEIRHRGPRIGRGFLSVASMAMVPGGNGAPVAIPPGSSGRRELADWIASPHNPLTPRVIVNRVWGHIFGRGLVATPDNFGVAGDAPSHPELLDYLSVTFERDAGSVKGLIRQMVLSRVYQLSSRPTDQARKLDPENRLLSHARQRRLDAESLRDRLLWCSGSLDGRVGGLTITQLAEYDAEYVFDSFRRSIYVPRFRNSVLDGLELFDGANPNLVTGQREVTTLPTQALYLMNSPFIWEQAAATARRLPEGLSSTDRLTHLFRTILARDPTLEEYAWGLSYLQEAAGATIESPNGRTDNLELWTGLCQLLYASVDFRYLD